ncbi:MAG: hypothetical protein M3144_09060 [Actinomycetota bacterium]|nr:hypothetical protein [Actinomycetota bacterium]
MAETEGRGSLVHRAGVGRVVRSPWFVLAAGFVTSRAVYAALGVRFDSVPYREFWQYVDPVAVGRDPVGSFLHLHIQPPLFNMAMIGAGKASPFPVGPTLHVLFLATGLALAAASFALLRRFGVADRPAVAVALLVACNPTAILYENWLFYAYPTALLLVVATLLITRYAQSRRSRDAVLFFAAMAAVILTRSVFHAVWLLVAGVGLLLVTVPAARRAVLAAAVVPFLLVCALLVKNLVLFDQFSSSSWLGMNLARISTFQIPEGERHRLVRDGDLSALALRPTFAYYDLYADSGFGTVRPGSGHPVIDEAVKSDGSPNFNYAGYLGIYRQYLTDALASIRLRPGAYVRGQATAFVLYLNSPSDYLVRTENQRRIAALDATWRTVAYGEVPRALTDSLREDQSPLVNRMFMMGLSVAAVLAAVALVGGRLLVAVVRRRRTAEPAIVGLLFAWLTLCYFTVVVNAVELGENQRFRFEVEPLLVLLAAGLGHELWRRPASSAAEVRPTGGNDESPAA